MKLLAALLLAAGLAAGPRAGSADDYPAVPLLSGSQTVVGEDVVYPTTGKAVVTAMIVILAPGEKTVVHRHGVPLFAYILEGEVTVDYGTFGNKTYRQGQSFLEAMHVEHAGHNSGGVPVKILAVYMGAEGSQDVIAK